MQEREQEPEVLVTWDDRVGRIALFSLLVSFLLHVAPLGVAFLAFDLHVNTDLDVEWLQQFDTLEGVGSSGGRFVHISEVPPPVAKTPEPPPEPEPPAPEPPREDTAPEEPVKISQKSKPKAKKPPSNATVPTRDTPRSELAANTANPFEAQELPGLQRSGPADLPQMEGYGPGNAIFSALLRLDRVRDTPLEEPVRRILRVVPDYRIALENTGIDPVRDLDTMFMASAMPQYVQHTFLAVRHGLSSQELKASLDYRYTTPMAWSEYRGYDWRPLVPSSSKYQDPRRVLLARPGLAVLTRAEWFEELTNELPEDSELRAGSQAKVSMLDGLEQIERAAPDGTLLLMSAHGAVVILPGVGRLKFEASRVAIRDAAAPKVEIDITFPTKEDARKFASACPNLRDQMIASVPLLVRGTAHNILDRVTCEASDRFVAIRAAYLQNEVVSLLNLGVTFVPRPPALNQLPVAPPPRERPRIASTAGVSDAGSAEDAAQVLDAGPTEPAAVVPSEDVNSDEDETIEEAADGGTRL